MKALIVIDIEDKAFEYYSKQNPKALTVDLMDHVGESRGFYRPKILSLKPMPQKKKIKEIKHLEDFVDIETQYDYITNKIVGKINYDVEAIFNEGHNSCIDKILGEEE